MRKSFILFCIAILFFNMCGCSGSLSKETRGNETVINVGSEDEEMNLIIEQARHSINDFLEEFKNPNTTGVDFSVKYPFDTDPGSKSSEEHIWLVNLEIHNDKYYGIVANEPFYINDMKIGDKVEYDIEKISDWKYIKDGFLVGGKSIVYFYNQMSEQEKKDFEKEAGFKIKSN